MKRTLKNEQGIANTMATFNNLVKYCSQLGDAYKPARADMMIPSAQATHDDTMNVIETDARTLALLIKQGKEREKEFDGIDLLVTRVISAFKACGASAELVRRARTYQRKLRGSRATPIPDDPQPGANAAATGDDTTTETSYRSSRQTSFVNKAKFFAGLIELLKTQDYYKPNEFELSVEGLTKKHEAMVTANAKTGELAAARDISLATRKEKINHPVSGVVAIGNRMRDYIKSVFGTKSEQYKDIKGIQFKKDTD